MSVSLCTIARNEERFLAGMLESVRDLVSEIIIGIDARSTDDTAEIASAYGARTFPFEWQDSFAEARNLTLARARGDWILVLDPDERLLKLGRALIRAMDRAALDLDGYRMVSLENGRLEPTSARLFRNVPDLRYVGRVHEEVRYLPDPSRTSYEMLEGGPHILHLGGNHQERDKRLLDLRLRDNPDDAVAYCYLALLADQDGAAHDAHAYAERALGCGPRTLHPERVAQLERMLGG